MTIPFNKQPTASDGEFKHPGTYFDAFHLVSLISIESMPFSRGPGRNAKLPPVAQAPPMKLPSNMAATSAPVTSSETRQDNTNDASSQLSPFPKVDLNKSLAEPKLKSSDQPRAKRSRPNSAAATSVAGGQALTHSLAGIAKQVGDFSALFAAKTTELDTLRITHVQLLEALNKYENVFGVMLDAFQGNIHISSHQMGEFQLVTQEKLHDLESRLTKASGTIEAFAEHVQYAKQEHQREVGTLKADIEKLAAEKQGWARTSAGLKHEIDNVRSDFEKLKQDVRSLLGGLKDWIPQRVTQVRNLVMSVSVQWQQDHSSQESQWAEVIGKLNDRIKDLESDKDLISASLAAAEAESKHSMERATELVAEKERLNSSLKEKEDQLNLKSEQCDALQNDLAQLHQDASKSLRSELKETTSKYSELHDLLIELVNGQTQASEKTSMAVKALEQEVTQLKLDNAQLHATSEEWRQKYEALQVDYELAKAATEELPAAVESEELINLKQRNDELEHKVGLLAQSVH